MRKFSILFILAAVLLAGCSLLGGGTTTITGTINGSTVNVVVAVFSDDYWFLDDNTVEDVVASEFSGGTSFTPIVKATISGTGYSIDLPEDPETVGDLIAWVDADQDGVFDFGDGETGYFPIKNVGGTEYVISIGYLFGNYTYGYYDGSTNQIVTISSDSDAAGFNFTVD